MALATAPRPAPAETLLAWFIRILPIRIALFAAGIGGALAAVNHLMAMLAGALGDGWPVTLVRVALSLVTVHFIYRGLTRLLEGRSADELAGRGAASETIAGAVIGAVLVALTVAFVAALGFYHVEGAAAWTALLTAVGLVTLVEAYEAAHWPVAPPDPVAAIQHVMEARGLEQKDLAALIGSQPRASEVLNRRRPLTLPMIRALSRAWNLPADLLVREYDLAPAL